METVVERPPMDFWRQADIISQEDLNRHPISLIGAGGIGSPTALALAKMGVSRITVYDDDVVELHNLPNQIFRFSDLEKSKVEGIADICRDFAGTEVVTVPERLADHPLKGIVVSGVDSMASRKEIWERVKYNIAVEFYCEARMGAEVFMIHSVNPTDPDDVEWYETTLYSDEEASELPCTARAVIYNVFVISGLIANQVKKFSVGDPYHREIIMDLATMTLLTQSKRMR